MLITEQSTVHVYYTLYNNQINARTLVNQLWVIVPVNPRKKSRIL